MADGRPVPWPTDEEFAAVIATRSRPADRLLLLALRLHDPYGDSAQGAMPGYRRLARLTGLSPKTVRTRLSALAKGGCLARRRWGRFAVYYIVARPVTTSVDMSPPVRTRDVSTPVRTRGAATCQRRVNKLGAQKRELITTTASRETWLTAFGDAWKARCGGEPNYGQLAKVLQALVTEHGADVVLTHWKTYLGGTDPKFASASRFTQTYGSWGPRRGNARDAYLTPAQLREL